MKYPLLPLAALAVFLAAPEVGRAQVERAVVQVDGMHCPL